MNQATPMPATLTVEVMEATEEKMPVVMRSLVSAVWIDVTCALAKLLDPSDPDPTTAWI